MFRSIAKSVALSATAIALLMSSTGPAEAAIVSKSKSNITNNRTANPSDPVSIAIVVIDNAKSTANNNRIIVPAHKDTRVGISGLKPGDYLVGLVACASACNAPQPMKVDEDGKLAFVVRREGGGGSNATAADPRARRALPVVRESVEQIAHVDPCNPMSILCERDKGLSLPPIWIPIGVWLFGKANIDVNTASAEDLKRIDPKTSNEAQSLLVAERQKNGPFKDPQDFANRVCTKASVDFGVANVQIGNMLIVAMADDPKANGFKCAAGTGEVEIYNRKHNYVGHVTLLR